MKKFLSVLLTLCLMLPVLALGEAVVDADTVMDFDRESPVTDWVGNWTLVAAYIGEEYAEDNDIEVNGVIAVPENAVKISVEALLDASATGSDAGVMVDQAAYLHAHVYDMEAKVTFSEDITDDEATLKLPWDGWQYTVRGENDGDFNMGVGKLSKVSADDKSLYFTKVTGVESEEIDDENMKYVGMNTAGQLIVCYSEENLVKKDVEVAFAFIFVRDAE
ncbi:MAG: hypothetical protein IJ708_13060 [Clostridia bacterium]|nr:hypothetical protein [Clostridia bacterium]MBR2287031.1 hypothetical protein [Clostridia bacterium]